MLTSWRLATSASAASTKAWLRLRTTKTGTTRVCKCSTTISSTLRQLVATTKKKQKLFPFSATTFRRLFKTGCSELKVSSDVVPLAASWWRHVPVDRAQLAHRQYRRARALGERGQCTALSPDLARLLPRAGPSRSWTSVECWQLTWSAPACSRRSTKSVYGLRPCHCCPSLSFGSFDSGC